MRTNAQIVVSAGIDAGHQDPVTYEWVPDNDEDVVLNCRALVQAGGLIKASRRSVSEVYSDADGVAFVDKPYLADLMRVVPGEHKVKVVYDPIRRGSSVDYFTADAEARFVRPEDRALLLRYI